MSEQARQTARELPAASLGPPVQVKRGQRRRRAARGRSRYRGAVRRSPRAGQAGASAVLATVALASCHAAHTATDAGLDASVLPPLDARDAPADAGDPTADFIARRNRVYCEREIRCGSGEPSEYGPPVALCHAFSRFDWVGPGEAIDPWQLDHCTAILDELESEGCDLRWEEWGARLFDGIDCRGLWPAWEPTPPLPLGAACRRDVDYCGPDSYCVETGRCTGECQRSPTLGEPCEMYGPCASGLRCADWLSPSVCVDRNACDRVIDCYVGYEPLPGGYCVDGACRAGPAPTDGSQCWSGTDGPSCAPGDVCWPQGYGVEICRRPRGLGEVCTDAPCDDAHHCRDGRCAPRPTLGQPCVLEECASDAPYCVGGSFWSDPPVLGVCSPNPDGAACFFPAMVAPPWRIDSCPTGFACSGEIGGLTQCRRRVTSGSACGPEALCEDSLRCVDARCVTVVSADRPCGADAVCPSAFTCRGGRCIPWPVLGEVCDDGLACLRGVCVDGVCTRLPPGSACAEPEPGVGPWTPCQTRCESGICTPWGEEGGACSYRDPCRAGLECDDFVDGACVPACDP